MWNIVKSMQINYLLFTDKTICVTAKYTD